MNALLLGVMVAALLVSLVAGFLWAFASVVMPGIARLTDRGFVRAFQEMDGVIQRGQPLFLLIWVGSALVLLGVTVSGLVLLEGLPQIWLIGATGVYLLGVQLPTAIINIPLNNTLQACVVDDLDDEQVHRARVVFEARWNRWNRRRTLAACLATVLLLLTLHGMP
ncbi:anthrone oxygenase family protein [Algiphilus sp.]|uniref:anthrone oxygenase family protein n=1 Tax=Algiphilus sp. TaxID=1872431 RepID=UPI003B5233D2